VGELYEKELRQRGEGRNVEERNVEERESAVNSQTGNGGGRYTYSFFPLSFLPSSDPPVLWQLLQPWLYSKKAVNIILRPVPSAINNYVYVHVLVPPHCNPVQ